MLATHEHLYAFIIDLKELQPDVIILKLELALKHKYLYFPWYHVLHPPEEYAKINKTKF